MLAMEDVEVEVEAVDDSINLSKETSTVDDRDFFELNYYNLDHSINGTPITPITKYINSSANILVELRKQKGPILRTGSGSWTMNGGSNDTNSQSLSQDENISPCSPNIKRNMSSPPIMQKLRDHKKGSSKKESRVDIQKNMSHKKSRSIPSADNSTDYNAYIQSVRNNMNVTISGSRNDSILSAQDALSESCIDYGSPGSFSERAKAFSHVKSAPKDLAAQGFKTSGKSFSTNVGKNNTCPKCCLVIFKAEELVAAGAAWHKMCFKCGDAESVYGCNRTLTLENYSQYGGWPFCKACYTRNFKQGGTILGAILPKENVNFKRRVSLMSTPKNPVCSSIKRRTPSVKVFEDSLLDSDASQPTQGVQQAHTIRVSFSMPSSLSSTSPQGPECDTLLPTYAAAADTQTCISSPPHTSEPNDTNRSSPRMVISAYTEDQEECVSMSRGECSAKCASASQSASTAASVSVAPSEQLASPTQTSKKSVLDGLKSPTQGRTHGPTLIFPPSPTHPSDTANHPTQAAPIPVLCMDRSMSNPNCPLSPEPMRGYFNELSPVCASDNSTPMREGFPTPDGTEGGDCFSSGNSPEVNPTYNYRDSFQGSNPRLLNAKVATQPSATVAGIARGESNKRLFDTAHMIGVQRAEVNDTGRWSVKIPTINRWRRPTDNAATLAAAERDVRDCALGGMMRPQGRVAIGEVEDSEDESEDALVSCDSDEVGVGMGVCRSMSGEAESDNGIWMNVEGSKDSEAPGGPMLEEEWREVESGMPSPSGSKDLLYGLSHSSSESTGTEGEGVGDNTMCSVSSEPVDTIFSMSSAVAHEYSEVITTCSVNNIKTGTKGDLIPPSVLLQHDNEVEDEEVAPQEMTVLTNTADVIPAESAILGNAEVIGNFTTTNVPVNAALSSTSADRAERKEVVPPSSTTNIESTPKKIISYQEDAEERRSEVKFERSPVKKTSVIGLWESKKDLVKEEKKIEVLEVRVVKKLDILDMREEKKVEVKAKEERKVEVKKTGAIDLWEAKKKAVEKEAKKPRVMSIWEEKQGDSMNEKKAESEQRVVGRLEGFPLKGKKVEAEPMQHAWLKNKVENKAEVKVENKAEVKVENKTEVNVENKAEVKVQNKVEVKEVKVAVGVSASPSTPPVPQSTLAMLFEYEYTLESPEKVEVEAKHEEEKEEEEDEFDDGDSITVVMDRTVRDDRNDDSLTLTREGETDLFLSSDDNDASVAMEGENSMSLEKEEQSLELSVLTEKEESSESPSKRSESSERSPRIMSIRFNKAISFIKTSIVPTRTASASVPPLVEEKVEDEVVKGKEKESQKDEPKRSSVTKMMSNMIKKLQIGGTAEASPTATASVAERSVCGDEVEASVVSNTSKSKVPENSTVTFYQQKAKEEGKGAGFGVQDGSGSGFSMEVDLGPGTSMFPTRYSLITASDGLSNKMMVPRNWKLMGREHLDQDWVLLRAHTKDSKLPDKPSSAASWSLGPKEKTLALNRWSTRKKETTWREEHVRGFRYYLLLQTGSNSSGESCELVISAVSFTGVLLDAN